MSNPIHNLIHTAYFVPGRQFGPINHQNRQVKRTSGVQFGTRSVTARVLRHVQVDAMLSQQCVIGRQIKRSAINDDVVIGQRRRRVGRINETQNIVVLRLGDETGNLGPADGQKDTFRVDGQPLQGGVHIRRVRPVITFLRCPCRAVQRDQRHAAAFRSGDGVAAYLRGKRVRGIDHMSDFEVFQIGHKTFNTAKTACAGRDGLFARSFGAPGIGQHCIHRGIDKTQGKIAGTIGAAEDQKVWAHG